MADELTTDPVIDKALLYGETIAGVQKKLTITDEGSAHVTSKMNGTFVSDTLLNTTPVVVSLAGCPLPASVWVVPGSGDTVKVEYSLDDGLSYDIWPLGSVTSRAKDTLLSGATHLKFTATTDVSHASTYGVC